MNRNIALCIVLSIVTCGIYGLYWMIKLNDETIQLSGQGGTSGGMVILLTLVTCGIYGFYWSYKLGERIDIMAANNGMPGGNHSIMFLILSLVGLGVINYAIAQSEINKLAA